MTTLDNSISINASPEDVWAVLSRLDLLDTYDPGVKRSQIVSPAKQGVGAARRCDLPKGWFEERVIEWTPAVSLAFELTDCTLPVQSLTHRYVFESSGSTTVVRQHMEYRLKLGPIGALMDAIVVRRKWDQGNKAFLRGLKVRVEEN